MKNYSNRIVCFFDLLGFKNHISETVSGNQEISYRTDKIIQAFDSIKEYCKQSDYDSRRKSDFQFTHFSDSIIISSIIEKNSQLFHILLRLLWAQAGLARNGIMCRGGIAVGLAIHDEKYVFGPAIVKAVDLEKNAIYPRIIVSEEVLRIGAKNSAYHTEDIEYEYLNNIVSKDRDGCYYVDYFGKIMEEFDCEYDHPLYLHDLGKHIEKGLEHDKECVREKYSWMRSKFNDLVSEIHQNLEYSSGRGVDPELLNAYSELTQIP